MIDFFFQGGDDRESRFDDEICLKNGIGISLFDFHEKSMGSVVDFFFLVFHEFLNRFVRKKYFVPTKFNFSSFSNLKSESRKQLSAFRCCKNVAKQW